MRTKHLCVLINIITKVKAEVGTNKMFKPSSDCLADSSKAVLLCPLLLMFHVYICYSIVSAPCSLVITCCVLAALSQNRTEQIITLLLTNISGHTQVA